MTEISSAAGSSEQRPVRDFKLRSAFALSFADLLVSFSAFGFILSYYMPILVLGYRQRRGQMPRSNAWGERSIRLITAVAVVWLTAEIVNLVWPRSVTSDWYLNWGVLIRTGVLAVLGMAICLRSFRSGSSAAQARSSAPVAAEAEGR